MTNSLEPTRPAAPRSSLGKKPGLALVALVLALLVLASVGRFILYPVAAASYHSRLARQALAAEDLDAARLHAEQCLRLVPNRGETLLLLARACRRAGDLDAARAHLEAAQRLPTPTADTDLEARLLQAQAGAADAAVLEGLWRAAAAGHPDEEIILEALARGYLRGQFVNEAYRCTALWGERHDASATAKFWHGEVLESGLRFDLAIDAYRQALERQPNGTKVHLRLAEVLVRGNRHAEAVPHFEAVLAAVPDQAAALAGLARCRRVLGQRSEAIVTLERLLARAPDDADGLLLRGQLALDEDRAEEALPWLQRATAAAPHSMDAHYQLAQALRRLGRAGEAEEVERRHRRLEQDYRRMDLLTREAIEHPDDADRRCEAGTILVRLGRDREAVQWFASALVVDRNHQATRQALAECLPRLGDPELADRFRRLVPAAGDTVP